MKSVDILFDAMPGPEGGRFVEAHDSETDKAVKIGEWVTRDDGLCALRIPLNSNSIESVVSESFIENPMDRDRLAIQVVKTLLTAVYDRAVSMSGADKIPTTISKRAYVIADAMIAESKRA